MQQGYQNIIFEENENETAENIVSWWNRRRGEDVERGKERRKKSERERERKMIRIQDLRPLLREEKAPRVVPGGPRSVEMAQRLKTRGIILL